MSWVQGLGGNGADPADVTTVLSPSLVVTSGNTILVGWWSYYDTAHISGITDDLGNVYSFIERTEGTDVTCELWSAPVTVGGTLGTITVSHPSVGIRGVVAAEMSGLGAPVAAGGLWGITGDDEPGVWEATWVPAVTIPAGGTAVGFTGTIGSGAHTAGAESGSPGLLPVLGADNTGGGLGTAHGSFVYATAYPSAVYGFTGRTHIDNGGRRWACAGAVFGWNGTVTPDPTGGLPTPSAADLSAITTAYLGNSNPTGAETVRALKAVIGLLGS